MNENLSQMKIPHSYEAECYVVGCLILDNEIADEVFSQVSSKDFYNKETRTIMEAIESLEKQHIEIDQTTVVDELTKHSKLEAAGGIENIHGMIATIPSVANIQAYLTLIAQKSSERKLFNCVEKIRENILKGDFNHDDLLIKSEKAFTEALKGQSKDDLKRVDLLTENVIKIIEHNKGLEGHLVGLDTGYTQLNKLTSGFKNGELIIIGARPAVGKSTFALNLAENFCKRGKGCAYFSLEMGDDQLIMRMLSTFSGIQLQQIVGGDISDEEFAITMQAKADVDRLPLYIDQSSTSNLRDIKVKCQQLKNEGKLDVIIIDYLQLLSSGENKGNRVEEISIISRGLKEMARTFNIPVIALSQLSRQIETREDKTPVMADLRESGSIEQDADIVMFLHRDFAKKADGTEDTSKRVTNAKTKIIIAKNRQGMTGDFELLFKGANSVFAEMEGK